MLIDHHDQQIVGKLETRKLEISSYASGPTWGPTKQKLRKSSNEADKIAMRRAEWTITARRAVLRLAQTKHRYFVPEHCKQIAIFSGTSHQKRSYLGNISTNQWYIVGSTVSSKGTAVAEWRMKVEISS